MARSELGTKRICPTTGKKFYDLNRDPVVSPYTGEIVPTSVLTPFARVAAPVVSRKAPEADEDESETEGPELVSLDEVEAEEADTDSDAGTDDALEVEEDSETADDDTLVVDDDDDDATDLIDVEGDDED